MPAQYLVRFDDICPGMNWRVWAEVESVLVENGVKPLLAVVPDNRDPLLDVQPPISDFWQRVRNWQSMGWSIGLHGYQHRYVTKSSGLIGRNHYSEFAGLPRDVQREKLSNGLKIFNREGVRADAWVAPAHSFDDTTVELLSQLGVPVISDGYALFPFVCRRGLQWVPQQIGRFRRMPFGTWTVCLHLNTWTEGDVREFRDALREFKASLSDLRQICGSFEHRSQGLADQLFFASFRALRGLKG